MEQKVITFGMYCANTVLEIPGHIEDKIASADVPRDDFGRPEGKFIVTVEWVSEMDAWPAHNVWVPSWESEKLI